MDAIAGRRSALSWAVHISVLALVLLWLFPTVGLFVSSFRTADQIATSGWWKAPFPSVQNLTKRTAPPAEQKRQGELWVIEGNLFEEGKTVSVSRFGVSSRAPAAYAAGEVAPLRRGGEVTVDARGNYRMTNTEPFSGKRGQRIFVPPRCRPSSPLPTTTRCCSTRKTERAWPGPSSTP